MQEIFLENNGNLIGEEAWKKLISSMENSFDSLETNKERIKRVLKENLIEAVKKRTDGLGHYGILFSGVVDSSTLALISKQLGRKFTCYSVGTENSQDLESAQRVAEECGFELEYMILSLDELEESIKKTLKILKNPDIVWASVGSVVNAACSLAIENGDRLLMGGLGSEEIFAGYKRHEDSLNAGNFEALHKECWTGLKNMWQRDLLRDCRIASSLGVRLLTPYLDIDLINSSMKIHPMYKMSYEDKKIILREAAEEIGLKKEFAWRQKKAAQYGSNFVRGMDKLARRAGFEFKKDYLKGLI